MPMRVPKLVYQGSQAKNLSLIKTLWEKSETGKPEWGQDKASKVPHEARNHAKHIYDCAIT